MQPPALPCCMGRPRGRHSSRARAAGHRGLGISPPAACAYACSALRHGAGPARKEHLRALGCRQRQYVRVASITASPSMMLLPPLLLLAGTLASDAAADINCAARSCCIGGPCKSDCCDNDGVTPCGGNSCAEGECAKRTCSTAPPEPPAKRPLGPGNWFPDCTGRATGGSDSAQVGLDGFVCFTDVLEFVAALNATVPAPSATGRPTSVDCAGPNCKLALVCEPDEPCKIPSELCMFPHPSPFGMQWDFTESCIFLFREMQVFMANVEIGPHISGYPMSVSQPNEPWQPIFPPSRTYSGTCVSLCQGGGGLLYVQDGSFFTGVNVSFLNGTAVGFGGAVTLNQGHLACANCTFFGNRAATNSNGDTYGGAIYNHNIYGSVILEFPKFGENTPSVGDDCSCAGYCEPGQCNDYCEKADGGALKCCVCSGEQCPKCCVTPGQTPISGAPDNITCRGMPRYK